MRERERERACPPDFPVLRRRCMLQSKTLWDRSHGGKWTKQSNFKERLPDSYHWTTSDGQRLQPKSREVQEPHTGPHNPSTLLRSHPCTALTPL